MDLTHEISNRLRELEGHASISGISAAAKHISIAETYYKIGVESHVESYFNDVIYRCNQSFEGMLKEAYLIISGSQDRKITSFQIENYFNSNQVLKARVMDLIKNYRQEWRNSSTHDHTVIFDEDEALLAISNISAFAFILLGDIIDFELQKAGAEVAANTPQLVSNEDQNLAEAVSQSLQSFAKSLYLSKTRYNPLRLESMILGYLSASNPDISFSPEVETNYGDGTIKHDLVARRGDESTLIEIKEISRSKLTDQEESEDIFNIGSAALMFGMTSAVLYYQETPKSETPNIIKSGGIYNDKVEVSVVSVKNFEAVN